MINNEHCPYCRCFMVRAENQFNSRSVEHLVPNAVLSVKRKNDQADFYACRKCNSRKSKIDHVLAVMAKGQANDVALASTALIDAVTGKNMAKRFISMALTARERPDGIHVEMPINGKELIEYMHFLGKGQYFKSFDIAFDPQKQVMAFWICNKQVLSSVEKRYEAAHDANPYEDLQQNPGAEVIGNGECIIWSKGNRFLFLFHSYMGIGIEVMPRNEDNMAKARECRVYLRRHFDFDPRKGLRNRNR